MRYNKMYQIVKELDFDKEYIVKESEGIELSILRPSEVSARFKNYDIYKNFQIFLRNPKRHFRPNHLRVLIDLNLRVRSRPDLSKEIAQCFDDIYYKKDPDQAIKSINKKEFEHFLNPIEIIANLSQLFIIEQDYCYNKESKFSPPTLFYQGWVREFIDSPKEIDNLTMSVCNRQPPKVQYTKKENKKHKKYQEKLEPLWYLK
ncbi:MAG: hypothetical protein ACOCV1_08225 [Bacillota bacterium]